MLSLTPTKLRDFLTCPQMYKLRHVERVGADTNSAALSFGRSLHAALEELHRSDGSYQPDMSNATEQLLRRHWEAGAYADRHESEAYFAKGREALRRYMRAVLPSAGQTLGTEVFMASVVNFSGTRLKLGCKADRVLIMDDALEVLDYKTNLSGRLPTAASLASDLPNFLYYLLARIYYPGYQNIRVSQLHVLTLAKVEVEYDQRQVAANKRDLSAHIHAFASSNFGPAPSEACAWCSVQAHCPIFSKEIDFDSLA